MLFLNSRQIMDLFFDFSFVFLACAISQFIGWFLRRSRTAGALDTGSSDEAYLIGGAKRVVEVAFFKLVRDGWITNEGDGTFSVRLEGDAAVLPALEYELLQMIGRHSGMPIAKITDLRPLALEPIRAHLVSSNLVLADERRKFVYLATRAPLWLSVFLCLLTVESNWILGAKGELAGFLAIGCIGLAYQLTAPVSQHTLVGEELYIKLLGAYAKRRTEKSYDRLWQMKDQVLFGGILALSGTVFASLPAKNKSKKFNGATNPSIQTGALHTASERLQK